MRNHGATQPPSKTRPGEARERGTLLTDAVDVILGVVGHVKVDDDLDVLDVWGSQITTQITTQSGGDREGRR